MPRKNNDPPKSPGGRFAKKGSEKKRRRGSGSSLPLEDGAKGKRGSKSKGEANQAAAAAKPAKKMKSTWVPTTTRQLKAVRLAAEIRPHQGRSRGLYETAAFCSLVLGLFLAHQNGAMESFAMVLGEPDWPRCYNFAAELIGMSRNLARTTFIRSYLLRYSQALALEREGKAMIVYFDEVCTQMHTFYARIALTLSWLSLCRATLS